MEEIYIFKFSEFLRSDDAFVLRFLRARKFDTFEAFKLFGRYFEYRQTYPNIFKDFNTSEQGVKEALYDGIPAVLENTDHFGRKIIVLYSANWDNSRYGLAAIYRAILLTLEKLIDEEESQINGFVIIVDWSQFTFRQSTWLNPNILRQVIEGLQVKRTNYKIRFYDQENKKEYVITLKDLKKLTNWENKCFKRK